MKILFVCTENKLRSRTAEAILKGSEHEVRSAGISKSAVQQVTKELLEWADIIFVMEKSHRNTIHKRFPDLYQRKKIECLYIPDEYDYMDPGLVLVLKKKLKGYL